MHFKTIGITKKGPLIYYYGIAGGLYWGHSVLSLDEITMTRSLACASDNTSATQENHMEACVSLIMA